MDRIRDGWMNGRTDGWMDGWMNECPTAVIITTWIYAQLNDMTLL